MKIYDVIFISLICISLFYVDINKQFIQGVVTTAVAAWYLVRRMCENAK